MSSGLGTWLTVDSAFAVARARTDGRTARPTRAFSVGVTIHGGHPQCGWRTSHSLGDDPHPRHGAALGRQMHVAGSGTAAVSASVSDAAGAIFAGQAGADGEPSTVGRMRTCRWPKGLGRDLTRIGCLT